ncbi:MAG TPA: hypothetical protein VN372_04910 [Methanospirillum sp.]|nr:hypothetical protein [Methanospirillum sp.]
MMDKHTSKNLTALFTLGIILLIAGEISGIHPGWIFPLLMIIFFPGFVLSLFCWWNASSEEEDLPFMGY